ncbi:hypothetical protein J6590_006357 [Homalodisca vitripennis]|nr:hypothetical protein J6590_006357 [Homalodisca vitripennis]
MLKRFLFNREFVIPVYIPSCAAYVILEDAALAPPGILESWEGHRVDYAWGLGPSPLTSRDLSMRQEKQRGQTLFIHSVVRVYVREGERKVGGTETTQGETPVRLIRHRTL